MKNKVKKYLLALFIIVALIGVNTPHIKAAPGDITFNNSMPQDFNLGNTTYDENLEIEYMGFKSPQIRNDVGDEGWTLTAQFSSTMNVSLELPFLASNQWEGPASTRPSTSDPITMVKGVSQTIAKASAGQAIGVWELVGPLTVTFDDTVSNSIGNQSIQILWTLTSSSGDTSFASTNISFRVLQPAPYVGTVTARYLSVDGDVIAQDVTTTYETGEYYETVQKNITGYTFKELEASSAPTEGYFEYTSLNVIYVYEVATYTAIFNSNGGTTVTSQTDLSLSDHIIRPADPTKSGYDFKGWFIDDGSFNTEWDFDTDTITGNVTLFAKWDPVITTQVYTAIFNSNGGTTVTSQTDLELGDYIVKPTTPTKSGYDFKGWFIDDGSFNTEWDFDTDTITGNVTLFAKWDPVITTQVYTAIFNSNGGTTVTSQTDLELGDYIVKPTTPTKSGYDFKGWFIDDGSFNTEWDFDTDTITGNVTLFAKWDPVITTQVYTAIFNSNGGTSVSSQNNLELGNHIVKPTTPTKSGYDFKGWFIDDGSFNTEWDFDTNTITGNVTLFAKWEKSSTLIEEKIPSKKPSPATPVADKNVTTNPSTGDATAISGYIISLLSSIMIVATVLKLMKWNKD